VDRPAALTLCVPTEIPKWNDLLSLSQDMELSQGPKHGMVFEWAKYCWVMVLMNM
jgi:hypothetical protein